MPIPLQSGVIYGPIESRRFGKSLGVNFLPTDRKVCNFNCVYCQYGFSEPSPQADWPTVDEIYEASEDFFQRAKEDNASFDWVMIAGNGEPTLYPDFLAAVDRLLGLRDEFFPRLPVGILSNASTCHRPAVREGLRKLDGCFMKLDAGDSRIFKRLNQPVGNTSLAFMLEGLRGLEKITLQSLFVMGKVDNTAPAAVEAWIRAVDSIKPLRVQVYTVDRPTAEEEVLPVPQAQLKRLADLLTSRTAVPSVVFA